MSLPSRRCTAAASSGVKRVGGAVVDAAEDDAVVVDGEQRVAQREDLEAAGVGEDRPVPGHEAVQPAELGDQLVARPEVQVVRVAEHDLRPERAHLVGVQRLDGRLRSDGHEHRRAHLAVRGRQHAGAGGAVASGDAKRADGASPSRAAGSVGDPAPGAGQGSPAPGDQRRATADGPRYRPRPARPRPCRGESHGV